MTEGPGGSCANCNRFHTVAEVTVSFGGRGECPNPIRMRPIDGDLLRINFFGSDNAGGTLVREERKGDRNTEQSEDYSEPGPTNRDQVVCLKAGDEPDLMNQLYSLCKAKRACYSGDECDELQFTFAKFTYANRQLVKFMRSDEFLKNYNIVDGELIELDKTLNKAQKPEVVSLSE